MWHFPHHPPMQNSDLDFTGLDRTSINFKMHFFFLHASDIRTPNSSKLTRAKRAIVINFKNVSSAHCQNFVQSLD